MEHKIDKKRLALVTWFGCGINYGTSLQSFALQRKLFDLGYDVLLVPEHQSSFLTTLRVRPEFFSSLVRYSNPVKLAWFILKRVFSLFLPVGRMSCVDSRSRTRQEEWSRSHYRVARFATRKEWLDYLANVDCFISGSDQIWNTSNGYNPFWFLGFCDGKKISYASSIGTKFVNPKYDEYVRRDLLKFQHISVREISAIKPLRELTGRDDIQHVVDPTFLLTADEWIDISQETSLDLPERYILCYLLSENVEYESYVKSVMQAYSIKNVVVIKSIENPRLNVEGAISYGDVTPSEFVNLIRSASLVCTDSFHGTALSINLSIPFVEFKRFRDDDIKSQNSRIYGLLEDFDLSGRLFDEESTSWRTAIDYEYISRVVSNVRESSLKYLVEAIEE